MIKLIATDIDGTLLNKDRFVSERTISAFNAFDLPKVLISARMPSAMYYLQEALQISNTPIICYNGALVLDQQEVLLDLSISIGMVRLIKEIAQKSQLHLSIYRRDDWYVPELDYWAKREINNTRVTPVVQGLDYTLDFLTAEQSTSPAHKLMLMGDKDAMDNAYRAIESELGHSLHLYRSKDTYTEITPKGTSKLHALDLLVKARFPEVSLDGVAAFGDNYNDVEMLGAVGYGVAVANARPEAMQAASYTTKHHKEDGVALWLEQNIKGGI